MNNDIINSWAVIRALVGSLGPHWSYNHCENMYGERDTTGELWVFENEAYDALLDYCEDHEYYPLNCVLAIEPGTIDVLIDTPDNVDGRDIYPIGFFLCGDEHNEEEIRELAQMYINVG